MINYDDFKDQMLKDPKVKTEYDALQPEYDVISAMIDTRTAEGLTQKQLSERTGITQADISRIENGVRNPTIKMLQRIADGLGMDLKIEFVPKKTKE